MLPAFLQSEIISIPLSQIVMDKIVIIFQFQTVCSVLSYKYLLQHSTIQFLIFFYYEFQLLLFLYYDQQILILYCLGNNQNRIIILFAIPNIRIIFESMEVQFNRVNVAKRVSKSHDILENFKTLSSNTPAPVLLRKSELLRAPEDFTFLNKIKHRTDEDFRLMINLTIGRIYLYMLKMIEIRRITDNYSVRYKLMNALVFKILDALNKIPRNLKGIFYSHSSFMTVIFKYQIEDILSNEANSIFQVHNSEATTASPVRVSINVPAIESLGQNNGNPKEVVKVVKSSYPFHIHLIQNFLKQISQKNQYQYLVNKLDLFKNNCDLDQFDQDFQRIKQNKNKNKNKNKNSPHHSQKQKSKLCNLSSFADSKQKISAYKSTRNIFNKTTFSKFSKAKSKQQVSQKSISRLEEGEEKNSIMIDRAYVINFDNAKKQYQNPFNKSMKSQNNLSSLASAGRIIEKLNVDILKKMSIVDSSSLKTAFSENIVLTLILLLCFGVGLVGILSFDDYQYRCGGLLISSLGFICSIVYSFMMDIDTQKAMRQDILSTAKRLFSHEPFEFQSSENNYHIKLLTPGERRFQLKKEQKG